MSSTHDRALVFGQTSLVGVAFSKRSDVSVIHCRGPRDVLRSTGAFERHRSVDVEDAREVAALITAQRPSAIVYCHAVCDVGRCEEDPAWAFAVNVGGIENVLSACPPETRVVYVSSDHVFGDDGIYAEQNPPCPISAYGRSRVAAEAHVLARPEGLVVRPGLAVGPSLDGRTGHMDWLRYRSSRGLPISIVADEARSAVWADMLAERIIALARSGVSGIRHVPARQMVSRPQLARHLMMMQGIAPAFTLMTRAERPFPHLGRIELQSRFVDPLAAALPSAVD